MNDDSVDHGSLEGLDIEDAVARIATGGTDPAPVRKALHQVTEDGVVSHEGARAGLSEVSLAVSTVENRTEVTADALSEAIAAGAEHPDLRVIDHRLSNFEAELMAIRSDRHTLSDRLEGFLDQYDETRSLYDVGEELRSLSESANAIQHTADELYTAIEEFRAWLSNPQRRSDSVQTDLDAIEESLTTLERDLSTLETEDPEGESEKYAGGENPAVAWVDATLRCQVLGLLVEDVHRERLQLQQWARTESDSQGTPDSGVANQRLIERVASLRVKRDDVESTLEAIASESWKDHFGEFIEDFEATLADRDDPIDWAAVQSTLEDYRDRIAAGT